MKKILSAIPCILFASTLYAQPATPTSKVQWDQDALDLATAQAYAYKHYSDGSTTGVTLGSVVCTGTAPTFVCVAPIPTYTQGNHNISLTASNSAGESLKSSPLNFAFVTVPATPRNLRIIAESLKIRNRLTKLDRG
jgi:hypothetical protein